MPYTLSIPDTNLVTQTSPAPITFYNVKIKTPIYSSVLPKRYSDFLTLHHDLSSAVSAPPPAPLPSKSWFWPWFARTVSSPSLTEKRRLGLIQYVQAIEEDPDPRWRESPVWRAFLGFPPGPNRRDSMAVNANIGDIEAARNQVQGLTPAMWLELHRSLRDQLLEASSELMRRENPASNAAMQHDATSAAKRCLVKSNTLILRLEQGLKELHIGEGETRRRKDLIRRAADERSRLENLLKIRAVTRINHNRETELANEQKNDLFKGTLATTTSPKSKSSTMPGAFPTNRPGRVLGAAKETDQTIGLNNQEVLMLQRDKTEEQDQQADELLKITSRIKDLSIGIGAKVHLHNNLLDTVDEDVDRAAAKLDLAKRRIGKL